jgi:peptide/nickel transport system substrate-binding protein
MRKSAALLLVTAALLGWAAWADPASAKTFRWAAADDVASLDPYSRREIFQLSFLGNIYEPLVRRDSDLALEPALATDWEQAAPLVWRFHLRRDVRFQDGTPFTAADVAFSFARATSEFSKLGLVLSAIQSVRKVDAYTVDVVTTAPDPILPQEITGWDIMSKDWSEKNDSAAPADLADDESNYAVTHANGTGPFMVAERTAGEDTVLAPNPAWWDKPRHNLDRAVFHPIADDGARVAALQSGEIDMIYSVPPQSIDRLAHAPGIRIVRGPGLTTIFLGFDQSRPALMGSDVKGANPFKDRRVREAFARAIDEATIAAKVMRGLATPAALLVGPGVEGFEQNLNQRPDYDPIEARQLLADAGYPGGFAIDMDCPTDRYVNDEAICQEVVAMLAKVNVRVQLNAKPRAQFFDKIFDPGWRSSFYLLGWTASSDDAFDALDNLAATRSSERHQGEYNIGGYSNPDLDLLLSSIEAETDSKKRRALLGQALSMVKEDFAYIPLHQQDVVWAARDNIELAQPPNGGFPLRYVWVK